MLIKTTGRGPDYGKNLIQRRWAFLALLAVGATGLVCYFFLVPGSGISGHAEAFIWGRRRHHRRRTGQPAAQRVDAPPPGAVEKGQDSGDRRAQPASHRPGGPAGGGGDIFSPGPGRLCPGGSGPDAGEGAAGLHAGLHPVLPRRPGPPWPGGGENFILERRKPCVLSKPNSTHGRRRSAPPSGPSCSAAMSSASWPWSWASPGRCCSSAGVLTGRP